MKAVLKSSLQGGESGVSTVPGLRTRTRASSARGQPYQHIILYTCYIYPEPWDLFSSLHLKVHLLADMERSLIYPTSFIISLLFSDLLCLCLFQGASPHGTMPVTTQWTAQMIQLMRSWRELLGQPLRGPASGRSLERGGAPELTENHVSYMKRLTSDISHARCMCKVSNDMYVLFFSCHIVRRTLKNGLTTEEANALGLSSGSEMQVWAGTGSHRTLRRLEALSLPLHCLHPSGLALKSPQLWWVDLIFMHLVYTGLTQVLPEESGYKAERDFIHKQSAAFKPLSFAVNGYTSMICTHKAKSSFDIAYKHPEQKCVFFKAEGIKRVGSAYALISMALTESRQLTGVRHRAWDRH